MVGRSRLASKLDVFTQKLGLAACDRLKDPAVIGDVADDTTASLGALVVGIGCLGGLSPAEPVYT